MARSEKTSGSVASKASQILRSSSASQRDKSIAGSALSQTGTKKVTSPEVATKAAKALDRPTSTKAVKSVAGSVLTQKVK